MLHVVFSDVEIDGEYQFERRRFGTSPSQLRLLVDWLLEQQGEEVAMESTAQYWKPLWGMLERQPLQYGSVQVRVGIVAYPLGPGRHGSILAPDHWVRHACGHGRWCRTLSHVQPRNPMGTREC
jgi:hypothetical protein